MNKKQYQYLTVKLRQRQPFPIDMLRYDGCVPASEGDSLKIENSLVRFGHEGNLKDLSEEDLTIQVTRCVVGNQKWALGRWKSFAVDI